MSKSPTQLIRKPDLFYLGPAHCVGSVGYWGRVTMWGTAEGPCGTLQRDPVGLLLIPPCPRARRYSWSKVPGVWDKRPWQAARNHLAQREWSSRDLQLHCFVCVSFFLICCCWKAKSQARIIFSPSQSPGHSRKTSGFPSRK